MGKNLIYRSATGLQCGQKSNLLAVYDSKSGRKQCELTVSEVYRVVSGRISSGSSEGNDSQCKGNESRICNGGVCVRVRVHSVDYVVWSEWEQVTTSKIVVVGDCVLKSHHRRKSSLWLVGHCALIGTGVEK